MISTTGRKLFHCGNGGLIHGISRARATRKRTPPTNSGGRAAVASLPAALLTPQTTTTIQIAPHSRSVSGESERAAMRPS